MRRWYNNGTDCKQFEENGQPDGWVLGRITGCGKSTLGKHWYTNGIQKGNFFEGEQPPGWYRGTGKHSTKGYKIYNNGIINKNFSPNDEIPEGWKLGRLANTNANLKAAAQKRRVTYYNNGEIEIKVIGEDSPPDGYVEGRLLKKNKLERDRKYFELGYIPLKDLVKLYGKSWYTYLDNIDKIEFPDPYVYINKNEIPRIEEYCSKNHSKGTSLLEDEIYDYIISIYSGDIKRHVKSLLKDSNKNYYELDFYIPQKNLAIEVNGIYWHSLNSGIDKKYHLLKTNLCNNLGIRLIHIFEDQWKYKKDICKSIIRSALGKCNKIYARKCVVKDVCRPEEKDFLMKNHIQGYVPSFNCIGLYYNDQLVQILSFRQNRFKNGEIELLRQCSLLNTDVIGGFSKLLKHCKYNKFVSYVDKSLFLGTGYKKVGFKYLQTTPPSYYYFYSCDYSKRFNRINFQKHKLKNILIKFDPLKTEQQNMMDNKYLIVYDCGTDKYLYEKDDEINSEID